MGHLLGCLEVGAQYIDLRESREREDLENVQKQQLDGRATISLVEDVDVETVVDSRYHVDKEVKEQRLEHGLDRVGDVERGLSVLGE